MRIKPLLIAGAALGLALPALAQEVAQTQPAPIPAPATANTVQSNDAGNLPQPTVVRGNVSDAGAADESAVEEVSNVSLPPPPPPVEYPGWARRDPRSVGQVARRSSGLAIIPGARPAGLIFPACCADGRAARVALAAHGAPRCAARRRLTLPSSSIRSTGLPSAPGCSFAWARRMQRGCSSRASTRTCSPRDTQVAVQSALANGDAAALCPLEDGISKYDPNIRGLVQAMCSSLAGQRHWRPRKLTMPAAAAASAGSTWRC